MDKNELEEMAKEKGIGWYKRVVARIMSGEIRPGDVAYVAQTPQTHDYNGFLRNTMRAYIWTGKGFELLFYNLSYHRAKVALKNYEKYKRGEIPEVVWHNYITGGYTTRAGLFRSKNIREMEIAARSHADYMGNETWDSSADHAARASIRADMRC